MKKEARFWKSLKDNEVHCLLCAHTCKIKEGKRGICGVRENMGGVLYTLIYGSCSSIAADPIEKKPLYHFHPGTLALSFGTVGCNFNCDHCQNYSISTARPEAHYLQEVLPEAAVELAQKQGCAGMSWTYNEPTIWHEYSYDTAKLAKKAGLYTTYVTNGYINKEPLEDISPYLDAMNVDVKAFTEKFYKTICKAKLEPVLQTCESARELGIHLEVTYLVIPGYNDSVEEVKSFCKWVVEKLGGETPVHFSRFHPDHKMLHVPATPLDTLLRSYKLAKQVGIEYPYLGNVPHDDYDNTVCPRCGNICVERYGFVARVTGFSGGTCTQCGTKIPLLI